MSDHNPYTFDPIARASVGVDSYVQAEDWRDVQGHRTHIAVVVADYSGNESITLVIGSAEEARRLKNLFGAVERRLS